MARLYQYKDYPGSHYLTTRYNGNYATIQCRELTNRLFEELDYTPGIKPIRQGPRLPGKLVNALWKLDLVYTGDDGSQDPEVGVHISTGKTVPLSTSDLDAVLRLLESYTGPSRAKLEELADMVGLSISTSVSVATDNMIIDSGTSPSEDFNGVNRFISAIERVDYELIQTLGIDKQWGSVEMIALWLTDHLTEAPEIEIVDHPKLLVALTFVAQQLDDPTDLRVTTWQDGSVQLVACFNKSSDGNETTLMESIRMETGDGLLTDAPPSEWVWDAGYTIVDWVVESKIVVPANVPGDPKATTSIPITTIFSLNNGKVRVIHSEVWGESWQLANDIRVRKHQLDLLFEVSRRHTASDFFPFVDESKYREFTSAVDFHDDA
ncbi:hypothetical protein [Haladaptatus sp. YSMS36]|uniref:hypothetical protein n=1 Tax=Haladaptatus sp. YSMS36 TaxID=3033384 RepID=UPI0023E8BBAD|nr:hypothetical protein [Haladaptatus sp. YSMS36]